MVRRSVGFTPPLFGIPKSSVNRHTELILSNHAGMSIGKRIKALRLAKGMKQKEAAVALGILAPSLSELENGESKAPSATTLMRMAKVYDTSPDYILTGKSSPISIAITSLDESELIGLFRDMSPANKAALLAAARGIRASQNKTSKAQPFAIPVPEHSN